MGKKMKKKEKAELLKDVCLHCGFMKMHEDKWPKWRADTEYNENDPEAVKAFNDLVRSAAKIVADVFMMLAPMDQMKFMRNVMTDVQMAEQGGDNRPESVAEVIALFKRGIDGGPTKH